MTRQSSILFLLAVVACPAAGAPDAVATVVELPSWRMPDGVEATPFELGQASTGFRIWGGGTGARHYFEGLLPAVFERTLILEKLDGDAALTWIFTGERGGFTITAKSGRVELAQRFYDSPAFNDIAGVKPSRHPEWKAPATAVGYRGALRAMTVTLDHRLGLGLALNGREVLRRTCWLDVSRHQLRLDGKGDVRGALLQPRAEPVSIRIDPAVRHQTMIGFGGIATPTAYAQLSDEGCRRWWQLVCEYNLLIQREYPNGQRLNEAMDNWDRLTDATPHYYGDNFPNGEISDFAYIKKLRGLGGKVWFEFWALPQWVGDDVEKYAAAMVHYCQVSHEKVGAPPEIVGIQNEVPQSTERWHRMTIALRRGLDAAGFASVRIHMSDDGTLAGGIKRAAAFRANPDAWAAIDFAATHMYDYQKHFADPDGFDATLATWKEAVGDKPFLSTELCVNDARYQLPCYRVALLMGELYHKNLVMADAAAICYCWTLLNVEQPSYGWTRALCVPDPALGFLPTASSHQLRVFGAYSRRVHEGMVRVDAISSSPDLLVTAFQGRQGQKTLVALNRATRPMALDIHWPGARFTDVETADPFQPNTIRPFDAGNSPSVAPGAIVTLTSEPLGRLARVPTEGTR
ncbi:MAG TPA: hypothetical protein PLU30_00810 [Verrucomicrobiae bacterium]|nr:hypothetical protein [Verrucomicrobiae bacterium]